MYSRVVMAALAAGALYCSMSAPAQAQYGYRPPPPPPPGQYDDVRRLHFACDQGDRRACIRFGMILGQHQEYRRDHPDYFNWER